MSRWMLAIMLGVLATLACREDKPSLLTAPEGQFESISQLAGEMEINGKKEITGEDRERARQELLDLIAAGKVDTLIAEHYLVPWETAQAPEGSNLLKISNQNEGEEMKYYAYLFPVRCGRVQVIIYEWGGTGMSFTRCPD